MIINKYSINRSFDDVVEDLNRKKAEMNDLPSNSVFIKVLACTLNITKFHPIHRRSN